MHIYLAVVNNSNISSGVCQVDKRSSYEHHRWHHILWRIPVFNFTHGPNRHAQASPSAVIFGKFTAKYTLDPNLK